MPVTVEQFLADIPALDTSGNQDPDKVDIDPASIQYWLTVAQAMVNADRWGGADTTVYNLGVEMFAAHHVVLEALAQRDMDMAGIPGVAAGIVAGKSAGDVAITYDTGSVLEVDAGHWNYTIYGKRFIQMARMMGAGPLQVGVGTPPANVGGAYSGPWVFNVPNPEL